jgi:hypothetical protein
MRIYRDEHDTVARAVGGIAAPTGLLALAAAGIFALAKTLASTFRQHGSLAVGRMSWTDAA